MFQKSKKVTKLSQLKNQTKNLLRNKKSGKFKSLKMFQKSKKVTRLLRNEIKKKSGKKQEVTEIVTVEEPNKEPETTVTVVESEIPEEQIPSSVQISEDVSEVKKGDKTIKKRTIKKKSGKKQEVTEIVTVEEPNKEPETTVTVVESEIPEEQIPSQFKSLKMFQKSKKVTRLLRNER